MLISYKVLYSSILLFSVRHHAVAIQLREVIVMVGVILPPYLMSLLQLLRWFQNASLVSSIKSFSCTGTKVRAEIRQPVLYIHFMITQV